MSPSPRRPFRLPRPPWSRAGLCPVRGVGAAGRGSDEGMTTAEYAVGTLAAVGFAGLLIKVLTSVAVLALLEDLVRRALSGTP